jgi:S-methyl-1-thioxylulose 5-phosphate methylthiotransferase
MRSKVHRFIGEEYNYDWEDSIPKQIPATDSAKLAAGRVVIGPQDDAPNFVFRYFVVQPGGNSTMPDQHVHDHGIYILHGEGEVTLNGEVIPVKERDMVYIAPNDVHGLVNTGDVPLGFICVIPNKARLIRFFELSGEQD